MNGYLTDIYYISITFIFVHKSTVEHGELGPSVLEFSKFVLLKLTLDTIICLPYISTEEVAKTTCSLLVFIDKLTCASLQFVRHWRLEFSEFVLLKLTLGT